LKWKEDGFFVSEAYTVNVHPFYQKHLNGKFYETMYRLNAPRKEILASLDVFIKQGDRITQDVAC